MLPEYFEERYTPEPMSGCWLWYGNLTGRDKRAFVWWNGKTRIATRVVWELLKGEVPKGLCVLHTCDNPACINPDHLYLGTQSDNAKDRQKRNRNHAFNEPFRGEANGGAKLKPEQVLAIRADTVHSQKTLASRYNVSVATISLIKRRLRWSHI